LCLQNFSAKRGTQNKVIKPYLDATTLVQTTFARVAKRAKQHHCQYCSGYKHK
jgi:hypothetical protein